MAQYNEGIKTFIAGEALSKNRRVYVSAENTVVYADAEHDTDGITIEAVASGAWVGVKLINYPGTVEVEAAAAIDVLDTVYAADDGKVSDTNLGLEFGKALHAASASGSVIEILPGVKHSDADDSPEVIGGAGGITALDLVYVSDQTDGVQTVLPAQATSGGRFADYISPNAIAAAGVGTVVKTYLLSAINTSAGSVGDPVYLSDGTAGGYTLTKPTGTDKVQVVGRIVEDHATTGAILFDLSGPQQVAHNHSDTSEGGGLTSPHITTGLEDANGAETIKTPATASAVNEITVTNAATGTAPSIAATGDDTNISLTMTAKGTGIVQHTSPVGEYKTQTATTDTATITIAQLLTGVLDGTPTGAATYTLPTAALAVAGVANAKVGDCIRFLINNKSGGANTITVAAGAGGTADGTLTVAQNYVREFVLFFTNVTASSEAYFVYGLGS